MKKATFSGLLFIAFFLPCAFADSFSPLSTPPVLYPMGFAQSIMTGTSDSENFWAPVFGTGSVSWSIAWQNNTPINQTAVGSFSVLNTADNHLRFLATLGNINVDFQNDTLTATFSGYETFKGLGGYYSVQGTFYEPIAPFNGYGTPNFGVSGNGYIDVTKSQFVANTPEPSTCVLLGTGLFIAILMPRRQRLLRSSFPL